MNLGKTPSENQRLLTVNTVVCLCCTGRGGAKLLDTSQSFRAGVMLYWLPENNWRFTCNKDFPNRGKTDPCKRDVTRITQPSVQTSKTVYHMLHWPKNTYVALFNNHKLSEMTLGKVRQDKKRKTGG